MYIKLDDIIPNRFQPREVFDEEALNKLADSIRQHGVIEPILVRPVSNKYEIIAGERRYKASVLAGLTKIPAIVRTLDDKESSIVAFIENEHRSDVSAIEEARTMERILRNNDMTQEELAKELGVNQSTIANKIRLLNLPIEVQDALMHNEISERHARSLLSVKDEDKQIELLQKIKERKMTVRELDSEIKNMNGNMNNFNGNNDFMGQFGNMNNTAPGANTGFNPNNYLNANAPLVKPEPVPPVAPVAPAAPEMPMDNGFMDFLNKYDSANPLPPEAPTPLTEQAPTATPENNDFRNILNSYANNPEPSAPVPPVAPVAPAAPEMPIDNGFMDFLNKYDAANPLPPEEPSTPVAPAPEPAAPAAPETPVDNGFMDFLNKYDAANPLPPEEPSTPVAPAPEPAAPVAPEMPIDNGFMDFLNKYDASNPLPPEEPETPEEPAGGVQNTNIYENPTNDLYSNFQEPTNNNVAMNNVTPPITSNFNNQYVENNENYVDISKQEKISSVDEIINKIGNVVKEIKDKSVYKVDTEEINYDDIYQITIKIDKRDF